MKHSHWLRGFVAVIVGAGLFTGTVCCAFIADKSRIKIAKIGNRYITRGDLDKVIHDMPDDERPEIHNKGDLQVVLRKYIEEELKQTLAEQLVAEKKINVTREMAQQEYDRLHPEALQMINITNPEAYELTKYDIDAARDARDEGIDKLHKKMLGDGAVLYRIQQALQNKTIDVSPQEFQEEYELRKDELHNFEQIEFLGIRLPGTEEEARAAAAQIINRIQANERFEDILNQYRAQDPDSGMQATLENNPDVSKFRGLWQQLHGAKPDEIIGPVFMPPSQKVSATTGAVEEIPGSILVLKVLTHTPETTKTLEEAKRFLAEPILYAKMMRRLYDEFKVEIYDNKLPDPAFTGDIGIG